MSVSKLVATKFGESARTLGVLDVDGWKKQFKRTSSSSMEHAVKVTAQKRLFLVTSVTPIFQAKSSIV